METPNNDQHEKELLNDVNINQHSSFYRKKEKFDEAEPGNRKEGSPKDINDPFYGTGSDPRNIKEADKAATDNSAANIHKDYDAAVNSGGSKSATEKQED